MQRIAVIDYGMGNLRSVSKALEHVAPDADVVVSADADVIANADRIVCPGQGAAADCMNALRDSGLIQTIVETVETKPFLGICMGLQVLLSRSEENGGIECIDIIEGSVARFAEPLINSNGQRLKVPHMGWSQVEQRRQHAMWEGIEDGSRFYFAHSFYCVPADEEAVVGRCTYGHAFAAAVARPGLFACQFHPEKSAADGLQLLANFTRWDGR